MTFSLFSPVNLRTQKLKLPVKLRLFLVLFLSTLECSIAQTTPPVYFQQEVNYEISVKLDDVKNELEGSVHIVYKNNSQSSLPYLMFHLWPNAYRDDNTALAKQLLENGDTKFYFSKADERGYINKLNFKVNDESADFRLDSTNCDIGKLVLKNPLAPGEQLQITTPFHVKLPSADFSRLGHLGQSYMISQWFPKPAVFDMQGWHVMPYLTLGEFYSEFGNFDVSITLPKNYVVGATGYLQDSSEINWLLAKALETQAMESFDKKDLSFPESDSVYKTIHYKAAQVHDFAWFADKRYHVLQDEIELPISKRKVKSWTFFTNTQANFWKHGPEYIRETILNYSNWLGEYPYEQVSIVDGTVAAGTGMEYPMVTCIGTAGNSFDFEYTVVHEVGHNWFYGILGSNERDNPWMDEGINTYYNLRFFEEKYPEKNYLAMFIPAHRLKFSHLKKYSHKNLYYLSYLLNARKNLDQACNTNSIDFTETNYGNDLYFKTGFVFHSLAESMGHVAFDSTMQEYYEKWKFKHPQLKDLRSIFEAHSSKNLAWFFDDLLCTNKKLDYKLSSVHKSDTTYRIKVKNRTGIAAPFSISAIKKDKVLRTQQYDGFTGSKWLEFPKGKYSFLELDYSRNTAELFRSNNVIRSKGIFKKVEPLTFQFLGSVQNSERSTVNYFPVVGYNRYDQVMAGLAFYNISFVQKRFEYLVMPVYSFGSNQINGAVKTIYHWNPNGFFQAIEPQLALKKYSYRNIPFELGYLKISPELDFTLRKKIARSPLSNTIKIKHTSIFEDEAKYSKTAAEYQKSKFSASYYLNDFNYQFKNTKSINPFELSFHVEQGKNYLKTFLESNFHFSYKQKNKSADIRIFGGKFLYEKNAPSYVGFAMSGNNDYAYDYSYLGRNSTENFFNQQFYMKDGGFKNLTLTSNSLDWMIATNLLIPAPAKIPLAFYADLGKATTSETYDYDWGVALILVKNAIEVYVPIKQSSDLNQLKFAEKIRFVLHLNSLNPLELIKSNFN